MPTSRSEFGFAVLPGDCFLGLGDGGDWLEGGAEEDVHAVADAALDSAATVGLGDDFFALHAEGVVVLGAFVEDASETGADLEAFAGG